MIDDNPADARLISEAWKNSNPVQTNVTFLADSRAGDVLPPPPGTLYEFAIRPDLILWTTRCQPMGALH